MENWQGKRSRVLVWVSGLRRSHQRTAYDEDVREKVMQVRVETFQKWVIELPERVTDKKGIERKVWRLKALFCAMQYINDASYFLGDNTLEIEGVNKPRENNVQVLQSRSPSFSKDFSSYNVLSVQALHNTPLGEYLFSDYWRKHDCHDRERS